MQMQFEIQQFTEDTELQFNEGISWIIIAGEGEFQIKDFHYTIGPNDILQLPVGNICILKVYHPITVGVITIFDIFSTRKDCKIIQAQDTELIRQIFWMALTVERISNPNKSKIKNALWQLMWETFVGTTIKNDPGNIIVQEVLRQIDENYQDSSLNLNKIIESTGYSSGHFRKLFKKQTGSPPLEHLNLRRLEHAKKIMWQDREKSVIKDVAEKSGFSDANNFTKFFKRTLGITPKQYIQQILKEKQ